MQNQCACTYSILALHESAALHAAALGRLLVLHESEFIMQTGVPRSASERSRVLPTSHGIVLHLSLYHACALGATFQLCTCILGLAVLQQAGIWFLSGQNWLSTPERHACLSACWAGEQHLTRLAMMCCCGGYSEG